MNTRHAIFQHLTVLLLFVPLIFSLSSRGTAQAGDFYCYYPSNQSVKERQDALEEDPLFSSYTVTVVPRFRDLSNLLSQQKPNLLLVPGLYPHFFPAYRCLATGTIGGKQAICYHLVSLDPQATLDGVSSKRLGIINEVGRENSRAFVEKTLGITPKKVRRVSKTEDLFPLLLLGNADYILIREDILLKAQTSWETEVHLIAKTKSIPLPVLASSETREINTDVIAVETLNSLGFDGFVKEERP